MWVRKAAVELLVVALFVSAAIVPLFERCPVDRATFERIEEGMTVAEVERILGGPAGDYRTRSDMRAWPRFSPTEVAGASEAAVWHGDTIYVVVWFDPNGVVLASRAEDANATPMSAAERIALKFAKLNARWRLAPQRWSP